MIYKNIEPAIDEFIENADIEFTVIATVNGERAGRISGHDFDSIAEQWHKLDSGVNEEATSQFYDAEPDYDDIAKDLELQRTA